MTVAVAYATPAGGAVVSPVTPVGMRDRDSGTVSFTTSLGFGRKLERMRAESKVGLAYHTRQHGLGHPGNTRYVLVNGEATFDVHPDPAQLEKIFVQSIPFMGEPRRGWFWDRWLSAYHADRVVVTVAVTRIVAWPQLDCTGVPEVFGDPITDDVAVPQAPPKKGTGPRVDAAKIGARATKLPFRLVSYIDADGYPTVMPVSVTGADKSGVSLRVPHGTPTGGRRAGLLAHDYRNQFDGVELRQNTGWLDVSGTNARYFPHTALGFKVPNKTVLLLGNGFMARRGLAQAKRNGRVEALTNPQ